MGLNVEITSRVHLRRTIDLILSNNRQYETIFSQITDEEGLGSDLMTYANANEGEICVYDLVNFVYVMGQGFRVITKIASLFERVEIIEQVGEHYKLRVPRENKSIGYLFGFIESMKQDVNIQEYSVNETSLE